jgi:competence ComEA-like helix-hairpin-helix protein
VFDLTPSERKGALVLLSLVALGAVADLLRLHPVPAPEPAEVAAPPALAAPRASAAPPADSPGAAPLDLNSASAAELDALPGIGPVLAARIVSHRNTHGPFRSPDDLLAVQGIGPRLLERLGARVTALPPRKGDAPLHFARPAAR